MITLAGMLVGCGAGQPAGTQQAADGHGGADAGHSASHAGGHAGQPAAQQPAAAVSAQPAPESALQLQALLGQHSVVAAEMMRARIRGDEDFAQSANTALGSNTEAIAGLIRALLGDPAAQRFTTLWTGHVTALFNYARGLARNDVAVRNDAHTALTTFENDIGAFLTEAAQGRLPRDQVDAAMQAHIHHLLQQADAYAAGDYALSNTTFREAYSHTFGVGKVLAVALLGPDQAAALETPAWQLRSELTRLLGEHVVLAVMATRAGVTNAADFTAAGDAVNGNTADLTGAIDTLFGAEAASSFMSLWADHLDHVMAYTAAVVARDAQRRDDAMAQLRRFEDQLSDFLGTATGNRLQVADAAKALAMHDEMLIRQIDAYAAKNYQEAHEVAYSAYEHMRGIASQLAAAFGDTVAAKLPVGGPRTGLGGMADVPRPH